MISKVFNGINFAGDFRVGKNENDARRIAKSIAACSECSRDFITAQISDLNEALNRDNTSISGYIDFRVGDSPAPDGSEHLYVGVYSDSLDANGDNKLISIEHTEAVNDYDGLNSSAADRIKTMFSNVFARTTGGNLSETMDIKAERIFDQLA